MNWLCCLTGTSTTFQLCVASVFWVLCNGAVSGAIEVKLLRKTQKPHQSVGYRSFIDEVQPERDLLQVLIQVNTLAANSDCLGN